MQLLNNSLRVDTLGIDIERVHPGAKSQTDPSAVIVVTNWRFGCASLVYGREVTLGLDDGIPGLSVEEASVVAHLDGGLGGIIGVVGEAIADEGALQGQSAVFSGLVVVVDGLGYFRYGSSTVEVAGNVEVISIELLEFGVPALDRLKSLLSHGIVIIGALLLAGREAYIGGHVKPQHVGEVDPGVWVHLWSHCSLVLVEGEEAILLPHGELGGAAGSALRDEDGQWVSVGVISNGGVRALEHVVDAILRVGQINITRVHLNVG